MCLPGAEISAVSRVVFTSFYPTVYLLKLCFMPYQVSMQKLQALRRQHATSGLQSHGNSVTIFSDDDLGEEGEERKLVVFGEPNWLVILAWVRPWKDPKAKI